jgi:cytochrome P450
MDVIGLAGFDYDFHSLAVPDNELANAFHELFSSNGAMSIMSILQFVIPATRFIPTRRMRTQRRALAIQEKIGNALIQKKKEAVLSGNAEKEGKDLLSLIVRANMDPDLKANQRMSDTEVLGQITTFFLAGEYRSRSSVGEVG